MKESNLIFLKSYYVLNLYHFVTIRVEKIAKANQHRCDKIVRLYIITT